MKLVVVSGCRVGPVGDVLVEWTSTLRAAFGEEWSALNITLSDGERIWGVRCAREGKGYLLHADPLDAERTGYAISTDPLTPEAHLLDWAKRVMPTGTQRLVRGLWSRGATRKNAG